MLLSLIPCPGAQGEKIMVSVLTGARLATSSPKHHTLTRMPGDAPGVLPLVLDVRRQSQGCSRNDHTDSGPQPLPQRPVLLPPRGNSNLSQEVSRGEIPSLPQRLLESVVLTV